MPHSQKKMHEQIREYIQQHGISQKYVAINMGITESRLSLMLNGKRRITVDDYTDICRAMALDPRKFYNDAQEVPTCPAYPHTRP